MELSERAIQSLEKAGCTTVYEQDWSPHESVSLRASAASLHIYISEGVLLIRRHESERSYRAGEHFCLEPQETMTAQAGAEGCRAVLGE